MRKIQVEWKKGDKWIYAKVALNYSKRGNYFVKHNGKVFVFKNLRNGTPVLTKTNNGWKIVGRIVDGVVFIGSKDELSFEEYIRTPEGERQIAKLWNER